MVSLVNICLFSTLFCFLTSTSTGSRVIELSDRFLDIYKDGHWLVMMYAPWCAHCKRLEPVWALVAQHLYATSIKVGKVDCTRFNSVAHNFQIKGFPSILFLKGDQHYSFVGDRSKDDIVNFALRLSGPPVQEITKTQSFDTIKSERDLYFLYVGESSGPLWDTYHKAASAFQPHAFFYQSHPAVVDKHAPVENTPVIFVHKENSHYNFSGHNCSNLETLNDTLHNWVNIERFPTFPRVTRGNIHQLFMTNKNLVLAIIEENAVGDISSDMLEFRDMVESVIQKKRQKYHDDFQFGWVAETDLVNSIAMAEMPFPSLIVINTTSHHHHIPEDDATKLTSEAIEIFLEHIRNESATKYGGNSVPIQIYRTWYELKSQLTSMWKGNPILTMVIFGLPSLFLSLICYGICCPDILDAGDDEDEDDPSKKHMKKD